MKLINDCVRSKKNNDTIYFLLRLVNLLTALLGSYSTNNRFQGRAVFCDSDDRPL
jgi:hypothetical protein